MILSMAVSFDGYTREFYHYIAFGVINFFSTFLVYNEIVLDWQNEMKRQHQYLENIDDDDAVDVKNDLEAVKIEKV